jgi:esterase
MTTLSHTPVVAEGARPHRWFLVLHGLLGRGGNWRSFTQRVVSAHPGWGGVLVDLRMHGESQGFAPPHTVEASAGDLDRLVEQFPGPVQGVLGHSLGGKVALAWARDAPGLRRAMVLDASPGPRPTGTGSEMTEEVLGLLRALPSILPSRRAFVEKVEAAGQSPGVAAWLAMNLEPTDGGVRLAVDLEAMESLFEDVLLRDDWGVVESPPAELRLDFILGGRSTTVDAAARARLERLAAAGRVGLTVLPGAGHWVHVDDPVGTFRAVSAALAT